MATMTIPNQMADFFTLSIPKADVNFFKTMAKKMGWILAQKHTFSREFGYFSREDDFLTSSAHFFLRFFTEKPTCLHKIAGKPHGYRDSRNRKPT